MKIRLPSLILAMVLESVVSAQDAAAPPSRWSYGTEVIQTAMLNLNLRVQHRFQRWAIGVHGGFRPSLWSGGEIPSGGAGSTYFGINYRNWMYQAVTLGPLVRYQFASDGRTFLELDAFHRVWWFDRKRVSYDNVESLRFDGLRSERQDISAIRLLWGATSAPRADRSKRHALVMEGYGGLGVRVRRMRFVTHEGVLNNHWPPVSVTEDHEDHYCFVTPTLHFGIRLVLIPTDRRP